MTVRYSEKAQKAFSKMDKKTQSRILDYMDEVAALTDPRSRGKGLTANLASFWRYRVGDYRIICQIQDSELIILVVDVGHRREIYK